MLYLFLCIIVADGFLVLCTPFVMMVNDWTVLLRVNRSSIAANAGSFICVFAVDINGGVEYTEYHGRNGREEEMSGLEIGGRK